MNIILKKSTMISPASETPKKILWLSRLDMIVRTPYSHSRTLFIYDHKPTKNAAGIFNVDILKESLSRALVAFYPIAGRLRMSNDNSRYEIDCNAKGVLFTEAEVIQTLNEFESSGDFDKLKTPMPPCDYTKGLGSFPLLITQLTRFKCGAVCLGVFSHHHVMDGASIADFVNCWARLSRGVDIGVEPVHDRVFYLSPRNPPQIKLRHPEFDPPLPPLRPKDLNGEVCDAVEGYFKLSKEEIDALKLQATCKDNDESHSNDIKLSKFEILAAHVWQCASKARGLPDDQDVKLYIPSNVRSWLKDPILPQVFFGNVVIQASCSVKAKDIMHKSLGHVARQIHETMKKMKDSEYLRSSIDYLESQPKFEPFVRSPDTPTCPNLYINSWERLPFDEADFGWGKPSIRHGGVKMEGQVFFISSKDQDGSIVLAIKLFSPHMARFRELLLCHNKPKN